MKIAVLIPDKNDRPKFLANCLRMIKAQTLQPHIIELVNDETSNPACDITWRYRIGYERLRKSGVDLIGFIENDDWYSIYYLERMAAEWNKHGQPDIIGTNYTIYYHMKRQAYFTMYHSERSSAMSTLIKPDLDFKWCQDIEPYTDMHLWSTLKGVVFQPEKHICIGMKHGVGACGGRSHVDRLHRYNTHDTDQKLLKSVMDIDSLNFYTNYFKDENILNTPIQVTT